MKRSRLLFGILLTVTVLGFAFGTALLTGLPIEQPLAYNHAVHTRKADCSLCHRGSRQGMRAGIPGVRVCTSCHATPPRFAEGATPTAEQWRSWSDGNGPRWQRLFRVPTHVMFSHRRHTTVAGIACDRCHGDMEHRKTPPERALKTLRMRDCIGCHEQQKVTIDCTGCHR